MKLIIGLGNPGAQYAETRHNIGFMAVDELADREKAMFKLWGQPKNSEIADVTIKGEKLLLQKPITYMNLSGQAALAAAAFYKILPEDICAIHDELDLPFGDVRLKVGGGPGGHNGLKSLIQSLGFSNFARIRMGVGRPPHPAMDPADFVLKPFATADWPEVEDMVERAIRGILAFAAGPNAFGLEMNELNRGKK